MKAGEQLEHSQREAVTGGGAEGFLEARREEQAALERLVGAARDVLRDAGHSPSEATIDRVATTLRAAAVTEDGRELLRRGRLIEDLQPQGFEAFSGVPLRPRPAEPAKPREEKRPARERAAEPPERPAKPPRRDERRLAEARAAEREARAEARKLEREAQQAEESARRAERAAEAARRAAAAARTKAERASARAEALAEKVTRLSET